MQMMVIEYARNVLGLKECQYQEVNSNQKFGDRCDGIAKEILKNNSYGGSIRYGEYRGNIAG